MGINNKIIYSQKHNMWDPCYLIFEFVRQKTRHTKCVPVGLITKAMVISIFKWCTCELAR